METNKELNNPLTLKQQLFQFVLSVISLYVAIDIVGSVQVTDYFYVILAVIIIQIISWAIRPLFGLITRIFGIFGILFISFFGNALIVWVALHMLPAVNVENFWGTLITAWIYALFTTAINWVLVSQSDDVFISQILRQTKNKRAKPSDTKGFLFVQLDGVSAPVLDWQLKAGNLPNISKLIRDEGYEFKTWHTQVPSTTPASQAGILFGNNDNIPAFRWYEKDTGDLIVANQVKGAHLIEQRLSNGKGLLADNGVSIGNLFSGDAKKNIMVMSKLQGDRESLKNMREYSSYFYTPLGFMRSFILSIGEMVKEVYQSRKQVSRDMRPRINRHGSYILLRAITNVMMRDLQTTMVIQNMMQGANSIYVDYLDYDEIAHHAGIARAESLASLSGLDRVVGILNRAKEYAPRPYELVIVSDHGQSQGTTFKQLHDGKTLEEYIKEFIEDSKTIQSSTEPVEEKSMPRSLLLQQSSSKGVTGSTAKKAIDKMDNKEKFNNDGKADIVFTGSGNLGNVWINKYSKRLKLEQLKKDYPDLLGNLLELKGIGLIIVDSEEGPICISSNGQYNLKTNDIKDNNPLEKYPVFVKDTLLKVATMQNAPDIAIISSYDEKTGEVYAFEELVGNHGGIGGWQTEAILIHPEKLNVPNKYLNDGKIVDAETIHKIFKNWINK